MPIMHGCKYELLYLLPNSSTSVFIYYQSKTGCGVPLKHENIDTELAMQKK